MDERTLEVFPVVGACVVVREKRRRLGGDALRVVELRQPLGDLEAGVALPKAARVVVEHAPFEVVKDGVLLAEVVPRLFEDRKRAFVVVDLHEGEHLTVDVRGTDAGAQR